MPVSACCGGHALIQIKAEPAENAVKSQNRQCSRLAAADSLDPVEKLVRELLPFRCELLHEWDENQTAVLS
jgi:hypothetical protein